MSTIYALNCKHLKKLNLERKYTMNPLLKGVKVLDLSSYIAGPLSTMLMAQMGADIVKVEMPVRGDDGRLFMNMSVGHHSANIITVNHGRKSIEFDIKDSEGRELLKKLVKEYYVLVEGFRPGLMKRYGLDYETLKAINPRLIYVSVSTYGQYGPYSSRPGFDLIAQAESGIMDSTGEPDGPPTRVGTYLGDHVGALSILSSVSASLYNREKTGEGQHLDISLYESLAYISGGIDFYHLLGIKARRTGNHQFNSAPYGTFEGRGGRMLAICAPNDVLWEKLCQVMKREDLLSEERFGDMGKRVTYREEIADIIQEWLNTFEVADDALDVLREAGIPAAAVRQDWEMSECPQLLARNYFEEVPFPDSVKEIAGRDTYKVRGLPFKTSSDAPNPNYLPLPEVGEHNFDVYGAVASEEDISALIDRWHQKFKR